MTTPDSRLVALLGNPNCGKTTLFNALTGAHQYVGNWPGVTVERKEGHVEAGDKDFRLVDLPGIYSLTPYTLEEVIARDFLLERQPSLVITVVDASNLERGLNLILQVLELSLPVVLVLNMIDLAEADGQEINIAQLSSLLGVPVIPAVASRDQGIEELKAALLESLDNKVSLTPFRPQYSREIETELTALEALLLQEKLSTNNMPSRWVAIKLLEGDPLVCDLLLPQSGEIAVRVHEGARRLEELLGDSPETLLVDARYGLIAGLGKEVITRVSKASKYELSDKLDSFVMSRNLGFILFALVMWAVFQLTFKVSAPINDLLEQLFVLIGQGVAGLFPTEGNLAWVGSLVSDGLIAGVGAVLSFMPSLFVLFLLMSFLEDSGYLARVAFITDRLMHRLGLHGKSFIPLLLGFGCSVPAIMATRTLENARDRLLTILIAPLISCSARLPVYVLIAGAVFTNHQGTAIFAIYMLSIVFALGVGMLLRKLLFRSESPAFIMELPPYMMPTSRSLLTHTWERCKHFLIKAGTVILLASAILWLVASFPQGVEYASQDSYLGRLGTFVAPMLAPCGFGEWQPSVAVLSGFAAKEIVVSSFGTLYAPELAGGNTLTAVVANHFTPASGFAFMVFVLLYVPCVATLAAVKVETNSWKWPAFVLCYTVGLAWIMATITFQLLRLLGMG